MALTERQKIAHLMRRFAFGVNVEELDRLEKQGLHKTIDALFDYPRELVQTGPTPWDFMVQQDGKLNFDVARAGYWWAFEMAASKYPVREKLTLFWHDHFAVSSSKVENLATMLEHLQMLRKEGNTSFRNLLGKVTKDPAMLRWLDTDTSIFGKPNENFGREVLELFTVGIGNYSEKDIKELARAFTGWSIRSIYTGGGDPGRFSAFLQESNNLGRPLIASSYSEGFHDDGLKTVMGKTARFDTESALDMLAAHPLTARYITTKLWSFFAYPNPEAKVVERLSKIFLESKSDMRTVLRAIATTNEFWSEKAVRSIIKSPADYVLPLVRQLKLGEVALKATPAPATREKQPPKPVTVGSMTMPSNAVLGVADLVYSSMRRMGMRLLYPPDVAGWDWGPGWVAPAMMTERMRFAGNLVNRGRMAGVAELIRVRLVDRPAATPEELVEQILAIFDADLPAEKKAILAEAAKNAGGPDAVKSRQTALPVLQNVFRLLFASPEFQMC